MRVKPLQLVEWKLLRCGGLSVTTAPIIAATSVPGIATPAATIPNNGITVQSALAWTIFVLFIVICFHAVFKAV
jgi:hypothetical protein